MNNQEIDIEGPMKPGVWFVAFIYDGERVASTEFFVTPQINDQSLQFSVKDNKSHTTWDKYLLDDAKSTAARQEKAFSFVRNNISSYLDKMTAEFYAVQDICYIGTPPQCMNDQLRDWQICSNTDWSSFSEDSKSKLL